VVRIRSQEQDRPSLGKVEERSS